MRVIVLYSIILFTYNAKGPHSGYSPGTGTYPKMRSSVVTSVLPVRPADRHGSMYHRSQTGLTWIMISSSAQHRPFWHLHPDAEFQV